MFKFFNNNAFFSKGFNRLTYPLKKRKLFPAKPGYIDNIYSPLFPSNYPQGINQHITVHSSPGMYLRLTIIYASFAETENEATLQQVSGLLTAIR